MSVPVITVSQMREWERATWNTGQSETAVIKRVARKLGELAISLTNSNDRILILAGKGNNGADARTSLDHLKARRVEVLEVRDPIEDFAKLTALLSTRPALIIDGLFGVGLNRPLDSNWSQFIEVINAAQLPVLSVDVPSGLDAESGESKGATVRADVTLTVGAPKVGLLKSSAWPYVGRLEVANDVGLIECPFATEMNWTLGGADFADFPPRRPVAGHKGNFGHLAIIAGSAGYHGAAVLAARGAQRAQPGLITLFPDAPAYPACAAQLQAVMVHPWSPHVESRAGFSGWLVGPGLASPEIPDELKQFVQDLWRNSSIPIIADASALAWLPVQPIAENSIRVITPHPGEAARILNKPTAEIQANRLSALRELSRRYGNCWVVLKGHQTLVGRSSGAVYVNSSGNPYLAQGGSGDLLAGYLAGLLSQPPLQSDPLKTIRYAVWEHGVAADGLQIARPNWIIEDLAVALGSGAKSLEPSGAGNPS